MSWRVYIDPHSTFVRQRIEVHMVEQFADGSQEYPVHWGSSDVPVPTMYRVTNPNAAPGPDEPRRVPLTLSEDAARALMEELQRHFGAYAGVDYERLKKDYDRVVAENKEANAFIRSTLTDMVQARKTRPRSE